MGVVDARIKQLIVETKLKQEFDPIWQILYGDVVRGKRRSMLYGMNRNITVTLMDIERRISIIYQIVERS